MRCGGCQLEKFSLIFSGEILPGFEPERVQRRFARAFRIADPARTEVFFSGREVTLRRNLSKPDVAQAFAALRKFGMVTHIVNTADAAVSAPEQITIDAASSNQTAPDTQAPVVEKHYSFFRTYSIYAELYMVLL